MAAGSTASSRWWPCSTWSECNLQFFLSLWCWIYSFYYPSRRSQSCVTYRAKRNDKTSIHLPPETFTTETYSVLILLYTSYTMNSNSCYFSSPENMVLSILLKQCRENTFSSPEFQLLLEQTASYVFRWSKGIYRSSSIGSRSCTNRTRSGYFHALIYTGLTSLYFLNFFLHVKFPLLTSPTCNRWICVLVRA